MALRALLFSSDGTSTSTLCQVLTDLGIEADICSEMLVAVQRISHENYDAILVDWDQEADAISLLKTARERKNTSQALNLALVQNDKDLPRALQHGANSAIKKPVDLRQAQDTLSTARDLILSRRSEQKTKEERAAVAQAAVSAAAAEGLDQDEFLSTKTGFVAQTAPRSALEAQESTEAGGAPGRAQPHWQANGPAAAREQEPKTQEATPAVKNRWDAKLREIRTPEVTAPEPQRSQDSTGVFSSLPEEEQTEPALGRQSHPQYLVFALVGCLLVAGVLWAWAPGDSFHSLLSSVVHSLSATIHPVGSQPAAPSPTAQSASPEKPLPHAPSAQGQDPIPPDPGPIESSEVDSSNIEIIETKPVPRPGAQQPPSTEAPPGSDQAQAQSESVVPADSNAQTVPAQPQVQPVVIPVARPQAPAAAPVRANPPAASGGRSGVIIPDSLKTSPSQSPASSLEPGVVPEQTSRTLVEHRVEPDYPAQALPQHLDGPVVLQVWVARDGTVRDVKLIRGYFALGRAAFDAVRQWRFKPYGPNGRPIDFQTVVTVNFKYPG